MDRFYNAFMDFLKLYIFGFVDSKWMDKMVSEYLKVFSFVFWKWTKDRFCEIMKINKTMKILFGWTNPLSSQVGTPQEDMKAAYTSSSFCF